MTDVSPPADPLQSLYAEHHPWLLRFLQRKLGNLDHAADIAQDTFIRVLVANEAARVREPRAYLTTVASRIAAQFFRRQALERAYLDALASLPQELAPSPETQALVLEALNEVSRILDGLPARTREIFLLAQLDGLKYADIAQRLDISVNVVQKAMIKAFQHCHAAVYG